ncbi:MAG: ester cyclase [Ktedonobacteraceae bacterium]
MSTEENKALARRIFEEAGSQGNYAVIDEAIAPTFVYRATNLADTHGPADLKDFFTRHRRAAPDIHYTIEELVAEGEKVVVHWTITGTQQGDLGGIAPTGKQFKADGITIFRFANGHIVDGRAVWDTLAFLQQLGVIPQLGQAS